MRISDWSSDVCSSDLRAEVECSTAGCITLDPPFEGFAILHFLWLQHVCLPSDTVGRPIRRRVGFPFIAPAGPPMFALPSCAGPESGRASCREGVGQYVSILEVAVSLKANIKLIFTIYTCYN